MKQASARVGFLASIGMAVFLLIAALLLMAATPAAAQESRLTGRLAEPARGQVEALVAAARAAGLPTEPLIDRALEGAAKGAAPNLIVTAVTRLRDELTTVRGAFGVAAAPAELIAGASALRAGASAEDLAQLRSLRPEEPLTVAAAVLADLVAAGVPADTAVGAVLAIAPNAADADYVSFRRNVQRDIALGASPAAALGVRLRGLGELTANPADGGTTTSSGRKRQKP